MSPLPSETISHSVPDVLATLQTGLATPEHAAFRERLQSPEKNKEP
jgi:hypothetical protein